MGFEDVFLGASLALAATSIGALLIIPFRKLCVTAFSPMMAFSAGVMGYATLEMLSESRVNGGDAALVLGVLAGFVALLLVERMLPHVHRIVRKGEMGHGKRKAALLAGTITIHNIPEGLAIAAAFATDPSLGWLVASSIAVQDLPEGFVASAPLALYGVRTSHSALWGVFSGAVEFVAAIAGFFLFMQIRGFVPFALSFAAGAMGYVILFEMLPDAFKGKEKLLPALSFALGAAGALVLAGLIAG